MFFSPRFRIDWNSNLRVSGSKDDDLTSERRSCFDCGSARGNSTLWVESSTSRTSWRGKALLSINKEGLLAGVIDSGVWEVTYTLMLLEGSEMSPLAFNVTRSCSFINAIWWKMSTTFSSRSKRRWFWISCVGRNLTPSSFILVARSFDMMSRKRSWSAWLSTGWFWRGNSSRMYWLKGTLLFQPTRKVSFSRRSDRWRKAEGSIISSVFTTRDVAWSWHNWS